MFVHFFTSRKADLGWSWKVVFEGMGVTNMIGEKPPGTSVQIKGDSERKFTFAFDRGILDRLGWLSSATTLIMPDSAILRSLIANADHVAAGRTKLL